MKRYRKLLLALAAIASIYLVRATGLDQGLIDQALEALVEAVVDESPSGDIPAESPSGDAPASEGQ